MVGGLGSLVGVIFGALFIEYIPIYSPNVLDAVQKPFGLNLDPKAAGAPAAVYGFILLLVLYVAPTGIAGLLRRLLSVWRRRNYTSGSTEPPGQVLPTRREA